AAPPLPRARPAPEAPTLASLAGQTETAAAPPVRPPAELPASPRLMSVQKALAKIGYGPVRIDGRDSAATRAAIERFERDRRLPVTGTVSDRLLRELTAVSGLAVQ
ncbi:MAG TPA: peptidoglycan-binding domain-containing protein, partial [Xanthobacteraceae bacterium]|nr:peptidoglycan-binding domain-containing protein [Xanthobacteraceae bacterium]